MKALSFLAILISFSAFSQKPTNNKTIPVEGVTVKGSTTIKKILLKADAKNDLLDVINQSPPFYKNEETAIALMDEVDVGHILINGHYNAMELSEAYKVKGESNGVQENQNPLLGSWMIKEINYAYPDTTYVRKMNVPGRLVVTSKSYAIMYNPLGEERKSPLDMSTMTDQEKLYSFQTVVFNSGSYVVTDSTLTTTADIAKVAGFEGGIQYFKIEKEEDEINITMFDETYPSGKKPGWHGKVEIRFVLAKED